MNSFSIDTDPRVFLEHHYSISRSSKVYSYLRIEYPNVPYGQQGFLLTKESKAIEALRSLKDRLIRRDESISFPLGSEAHFYFTSEFNNTMMKDPRGNIIVPQEEHAKLR